MPELRSRGFDAFVATLRHRGPNFEALGSRGVPVRFVGMRSRTDVAGMVRAYRLWRLKPDVVVTSSVDAQVIGEAVALRARARHVTIEHAGSDLPLSPHQRLLVRLVAPWVDEVIAVSASQLDRLRRLGFRVERTTVIPNGIPPPTPRRPRAAVRAELGVGGDDVVALLAATLRSEKRAPRFVESVIAAHSREPRVRGVVAGGGPELELARSAAAAAPDVVRVLGERSDVADLIAAGDLVCLTSTSEALPLSLLEAMALGRPVLAMGVGGIVEAVADGVGGRLVAPDDFAGFVDALVALARAPGERRALGEGGRERYEERYELARMVDRYAEVLSATVSGSADASR